MLSKVIRDLILFLAFCVLALVFFKPHAQACTGIMLRTADESFVHGRTCEFGIPIDYTAWVVPRGYEFVGKTPGGTGLKHTSKYAAVGMVSFNDGAISDGMNEKGLSVGAFYFPTYAKYADITNENRSKALSPIDFPNWILVQFATVEEARAAIERGDVLIAPTVLEGWGATPPPLHYIVYDASGKCIVIEPLEGKLKILDNPLGVITNSPNFEWHITNLRNYIALNPLNVPPVEIKGMKFQQFGQGSGGLGLPGDFTPPSRFVRATFFSVTAIPSPTADLGIQQIFHILNNFDIPVGVAREKEGGVIEADTTQGTVARDPKNLQYYYKTYDDQTIRMVDLKKFDLNAKEIKKLSTKGSQPIVDMSDKLK